MEGTLAAVQGLSPAFWTFAAAIMTGMITALVTLSGSRRTARAAERKDALTANQDLQASVNSSLKMFNDSMMQALDGERKERAAMALDIRDLRRRLNAAIAHILLLERKIVALGDAPPLRPEGVD